MDISSYMEETIQRRKDDFPTVVSFAEGMRKVCDKDYSSHSNNLK